MGPVMRLSAIGWRLIDLWICLIASMGRGCSTTTRQEEEVDVVVKVKPERRRRQSEDDGGEIRDNQSERFVV